MSLHLYDSATRDVRQFEPLVPGKVGIYLCGATVDNAPHIGHLRSAIAFDILSRWLDRSGYQVTMVRNVTDIDDKILRRSAAAGQQWWERAYIYEREFNRAYATLGVLPPTYEPRATGHVTEMVELMDRLIERGHAYRGDEGNVYFDVRSFSRYGALTNQTLENLTVVEDEASDKRNPHDFALWKASKAGEPESASWPTPYGRGRPGWHLECSTMAHRYLGESFDIHGGGIDLRFPHHENEQAQSWAAGWGFTQTWMHNAWVTTGGEKMSKSLGNSLFVDALLEQAEPVVLRYALGAVHYRSSMEFGPSTLSDAAAAWQRITGFLDRAQGDSAEPSSAADLATVELPQAFIRAMDDDLGISAALGVLHETVRSGNTALAQNEDAAATALQVRAMLDVLGLNPEAEPWATGDGGQAHNANAALDTLISEILKARDQARADKDWSRADELRDQLLAAGVDVQDSATGAKWSLKGNS